VGRSSPNTAPSSRPHTGALANISAAFEPPVRLRLFETVHRRVRKQPRLFELVALGESGWLKAVRQKEYASRRPRKPKSLQQVLFAYIEAI
jgi:hypothetical protein